jgi:hypothetical protein
MWYLRIGHCRGVISANGWWDKVNPKSLKEDWGGWVYGRTAIPDRYDLSGQLPFVRRLGFGWYPDKLQTMRTLQVDLPYWAIAFLTAIPPAVPLIRRRTRRNQREGTCPQCRYDVRATSQRCPECGLVMKEQPPKPARECLSLSNKSNTHGLPNPEQCDKL